MRRGNRTWRRAAWTVAGTLLAASGAARGASSNWMNVAGGTYNTPGNWSAGVPSGALDTANFNIPNNYTVTLDISPSISTLNFGGSTTTFANSAVGRTFTVSGVLTASAGTFSLNATQPITLSAGTGNLNAMIMNVMVGSDAIFSTLNISTGADTAQLITDGSGSSLTTGAITLSNSTGTGRLIFGNGATGTISSLNAATSGVSAGIAQFQVNSASVVTFTGNIAAGTGGLASQSATITPSGAGSTITQTGVGALTLGANVTSSGTMTLSTGGAVNWGTGLTTVNATGAIDVQASSAFNTNGNVNLLTTSGTPTGVLGRITVGGSGASFTQTGATTLTVGNGTAGTGQVIINSGGTYTTGTGQTTIDATGAITINTSGLLNLNSDLLINGGILTRGAGTLVWADGKTMTAQAGGRFVISSGAWTTPNNALINVTGVGSQFNNTSSQVAVVGATQLNYSGGATGSIVSLVSGLNTNGTVTVDGSGTNLNVTSLLTVGQAATGVVTYRNSATGSLGTVSLGISGTAGTNGTVNVSSSAVVTQTGATTLTVGGALPGTLNIESAAQYTTGTGFTSVGAAGVINIDGGTFNALGDITVSGGTLHQTSAPGSTFTWASGKSLIDTKFGEFILDDGNASWSNPTINVNGGSTLEVTNGTLSLTGTANFSNTTGGQVSAQSISQAGGTFLLDGVTTSLVGTQDLNNTFGSSSGTISMTMSNSAEASFAGNLVLASTGSAVATLNVGTGATLTAGALKLATGINGTATLTVTGPSTLTLTSTITANDIGGTVNSHATLNLDSTTMTAPLASTTNLNATGTINITDSTVTLGTLNNNGGLINFNSGSLSYVGDLTVGSDGMLGSSLTLSSVKFLALTGATTINPLRTLTLDGGLLSTGAFANNGNFVFNSGTLAITGAGGLTLGTSGALGTSLSLTAGKNVNVTNATNINSGAQLTLDGGNFSTASVANSGTMSLTSAGTLNVSGAISNTASGRIFVGPDASFDTAATIANAGRIQMQGGAARLGGAGAISNTGLITGDGEVAKGVTNSSSGEIRAENGKTLLLSGTLGTNDGKINLQGGTLEASQSLTNGAFGLITGRGMLVASSGLINNGQMQLSAGLTDVFGSVTGNSGSKIIVSGGGTATFYDPVSMATGSEFRVSTASTAVFFGNVIGTSNFTGPGVKDFESGSSSLTTLTTPGSTLVQDGADLTVTHVEESAVSVSGLMTVSIGVPAASANKIGATVVAGSGKLDLTNNKLITDSPMGSWTGASYSGITGLIDQGRDDGTWDAPGLTTSMPDAVAGSNYTALGVALASQAKGIGPADTAIWAGQVVTGAQTLVMYTYGGDANLDGKLNIDDYVRIDLGIAASLTGWSNGDFNYDGVVNIDDYITVIDLNVSTQGAPFVTAVGTGGGVSAVPEPAGVSLMALLATAGVARRRKRKMLD